MRFSVRVKNGRLQAIESVIGESPTIEIRTGPEPATPASSATGTLLASIALPANWMNDALNGEKTKLGEWSTNSAAATGNAGHFRFVTGGVCDITGTISLESGSGDMKVDSLLLEQGQQFRITTFTVIDGN
jgi:hypothetical protein